MKVYFVFLTLLISLSTGALAHGSPWAKPKAACERFLFRVQDQVSKARYRFHNDPLKAMNEWKGRMAKWNRAHFLTQDQVLLTKAVNLAVASHRRFQDIFRDRLIEMGVFGRDTDLTLYQFPVFELDRHKLEALFPHFARYKLPENYDFYVSPGISTVTSLRAAFSSEAEAIFVPDDFVFGEVTADGQRFFMHEIVHLKLHERRRQTGSSLFAEHYSIPEDATEELRLWLTGTYEQNFSSEEVLTNLVTSLSVLERICVPFLSRDKIPVPFLEFKRVSTFSRALLKYYLPAALNKSPGDESLLAEQKLFSRLYETIAPAFEKIDGFENRWFWVKAEELRPLCPLQDELWRIVEEAGLNPQEFKNSGIKLQGEMN